MTFNNREIAVAFWLAVIFIWSLTKKDVRSSFSALLKTLFTWKIVLPLTGMLAYIALCIALLARANFWHWSNFKDTLLWTIGSAFGLFLRSNEAGGDEKFFRSAVYENLKFVAMLEFVVNMYTFPLWVEIVFVPLVALMVLINEYAKWKEEEGFDKVRSFSAGLLGIIGIGVLAFTIRQVVGDLREFATTQMLFDLVLPFVLTSFLLPFIYMMALLIQYETLFMRIDFFTPDKSLSRYAKLKVFLSCNFHLYRLHRFSRKAGVLKFRDKDELIERIQSLCK
ncbi:hypothetical protein DRQ11_10475 [candidate division KSB1 bacterium]|nr:MAG: hypothetical protein DRQ11_10475 [candidate division KSB1 bacterium]